MSYVRSGSLGSRIDGLGAVAAPLTLYWQADPSWSKQQLGFGSSTIGKGGCLLTDAAMAATAFGNPVTPDVLNAQAKAFGAAEKTPVFAPGSSDAVAVNLLHAAGLEMGRRVRDLAPGDPQSQAVVDEALAQGGFAIVHVDYTGSPQGDHFILVIGHTANGGYSVLDPAGKRVELDGNLAGKGALGNYRPVGAFGVFPASGPVQQALDTVASASGFLLPLAAVGVLGGIWWWLRNRRR